MGLNFFPDLSTKYQRIFNAITREHILAIYEHKLLIREEICMEARQNNRTITTIFHRLVLRTKKFIHAKF